MNKRILARIQFSPPGERTREPSHEPTVRNRRLDIQGLRAVAVLMVVAFHAGLPTPGGFVGVDVFFVVSGFVITAMLFREQNKTGRIEFGRFYLRRFRRLTPALALMIAVTVVMSSVLLSPLGVQQTAAITGIGAMLLIANAAIARLTGGYFDADAEANPFLHTWSLSVEEQFYLVFPALIALGWYLARRRKGWRAAPALLLTTVAAISFCLACVGPTILSLLQLHASPFFRPYIPVVQAALGFYSPLTRSWEFGAGALLALALTTTAVKPARVTFALGLVGVGALGASLWIISPATPFPSAWTLIPVAGTVLLLAAGSSESCSNPVTRALSSAHLVKIGDWSYSIYLWHWPFIVFAKALWPGNPFALLAAAILSVIPAIASYYWVETPIRNLQHLRGLRLVRIVLTTVFVPVILASSLFYFASVGYWSPGVRTMQKAVLSDHAARATCSAMNLVPYGPPASCIWNSRAEGTPMYLVGDSTAWHFSEAAIGASDLLHRPLSITRIPGCPFRDVYIHAPNMPFERNQQTCRHMYETTMDWLVRQPPGTVIISQLNSQYRESGLHVGVQPDELSTVSHQREQALNQGLALTIDALERAGHSVLLVQAAPNFEKPVEFDPLECTLITLQAGACNATMQRDVADSIQSIERSATLEIAEQTGSSVWDPRGFFCSEAECSTYRYGVNLYRDHIHISAEASQMLASSLAEAVGSTH